MAFPLKLDEGESKHIADSLIEIALTHTSLDDFNC